MTISLDSLPTQQQANPSKVDYSRLESDLINKSGKTPLAQRFRTLFLLKSLNTPQSIDIIAKAFADDSALLKHEVAYVLGQMKNSYAIPYLNSVLEKTSEDPMVRHEAAEALGAIGKVESLDILQKYVNDKEKVVSQTCELAVAKIQLEQTDPITSNGPFTSVDPAPPMESNQTVQELKDILLNSEINLFKRYRAMFSLRNINSEEAVLALAQGFGDDSALFRHEIAYIFGQMQHPASVPSLVDRLQDQQEAAMVRHECAEALGSIATEDCLPVLKQYRNDVGVDRVVRESCEVGLDMWEWENSSEIVEPLRE